MLATVTRLVEQDGRSAKSWATIRDGLDVRMRCALMLDAHVYVRVLKDMHLTALENRGWVATLVERMVEHGKRGFEELALPGPLRKLAAENSLAKIMDTKCRAYGTIARAQLGKVFAFLKVGVAQFMAVGDYHDREYARSSFEKHFKLSERDVDHDVIGIFECKVEVRAIIAGDISVHEAPQTRARFVPYAYGVMRMTTQDLEGDVGELNKVSRGVKLSIEDQTTVR